MPMSSAKLGDNEAAVSALERMLLFNPNLPRVELELGALYFRMGSFEMARSYFDKALAANPPAEVKSRIDRISGARSPAAIGHPVLRLVFFGGAVPVRRQCRAGFAAGAFADRRRAAVAANSSSATTSISSPPATCLTATTWDAKPRHAGSRRHRLCEPLLSRQPPRPRFRRSYRRTAFALSGAGSARASVGHVEAVRYRQRGRAGREPVLSHLWNRARRRPLSFRNDIQVRSDLRVPPEVFHQRPRPPAVDRPRRQRQAGDPVRARNR